MADKPWEKIPADLWRLLTRGHRKILTIPIFVFVTVMFALPNTTTRLKQSYNLVQNTLYPSTFVSRYEFDVCNEWVAVIWSYQNEEDAKKELELFRQAYIDSKHDTWERDIHLVRAPKSIQTWQIVMDLDEGKSQQDIIKTRLDILKVYGNSNRKLRNILGHWLNTATVEYYDMNIFKVTYGEVKNLVNGCKK